MATTIIRSGGETGVDRAALDFAIKQGIPYCGWCPKNGWAEDYTEPPGVLQLYPRLVETPSLVPEQRTAWNVRDSHMTIILLCSNDLECSPGTVFTRNLAELVFLRPCLIMDITSHGAVEKTQRWIAQTTEILNLDEIIINVAGPRESQAIGIYLAAFEFLQKGSVQAHHEKG